MIIGLIEHERGALNPLSLEMLTLGRSLAQQVDAPLQALLLGEAMPHDERPMADQLAAYGVRKVYLAQHPALNDYAPAAWAQSVVGLINRMHPAAVLAAGSERGNEVLAHVAARTDQPLAANCITVQVGDPYLVTRWRWGGSLLEEARLHGVVKLLTVAAHAHTAETVSPSGEVALEIFHPTLSDRDLRVRVTGRVAAAADRVSLADARVVIGGGRGVGSREGFQVLEALAARLGAAVGCSRAVTSEGWRPHADQIGQTGMRIAPDLYIACGISGAIQHMVGCAGAKRILAINTDPQAPILAKADYAVIGDLHQVLPAICAELRQQKPSPPPDLLPPAA
jgi:electron transfer flavoprotein alpha subunit